jgi:ABC-type multidrug transport system fused ATPase/permease subunit
MLSTILKLFGIDLSARMAEVQIDLEERLDIAKNSVEQAAQTAGLLALLFFLAGLAAFSAFGVGLFALYSWVSSNYGQFYGFAALGALLLFIAMTVFAIAISKAKSWRDESGSRVAAKKLELGQARAKRIAAATEAFDGAALPRFPRSSEATAPADDRIEPLVQALSKTIKFPAAGNPAIDELLARLQDSACSVADETVEGLVRAVRCGDRPQLFAALGGAMFVGWFLGRHSQSKTDAGDAR